MKKEGCKDYWIAEKDHLSGAIIYDSGQISVYPAPLYCLTGITKGLKGENLNLMNDGVFAPMALLCYVRRLFTSSGNALERWDLANYSRRIMRAISLPQDVGYNAEDQRAIIDANFEENYIERQMAEYFDDIYRRRGADGVIHLGQMIKKVESKVKATPETAVFLDAVKVVVENKKQVPTQKAVFAEWEDQRLRVSRRTFDDQKIKLGFEWLPWGKQKKRPN